MADDTPKDRAKIVEDIVAGGLDFAGAEIQTVYTKISKTYAVYGTAERVSVHFADEGEMAANGNPLGKEQRQLLLPLDVMRGEINSLIDGWRTAKEESRRSLARLYDRRVAEALNAALQGSLPNASLLLRATRLGIVQERASIARVQYLAVAAIVTAIVIVLAWLVTGIVGRTPAHATCIACQGCSSTALVVTFGALGALFSIALAVRGRSLQYFPQVRDNLTDAIVRIGIGAVSAIVLTSLLKSGIISFNVGTTTIDLCSAKDGQRLPHAAIVVAFLAGFVERLVGDLLGRIGDSLNPPQNNEPPASDSSDGAPNESNPRGGMPQPPTPPSPADGGAANNPTRDAASKAADTDADRSPNQRPGEAGKTI